MLLNLTQTAGRYCSAKEGQIILSLNNDISFSIQNMFLSWEFSQSVKQCSFCDEKSSTYNKVKSMIKKTNKVDRP